MLVEFEKGSVAGIKGCGGGLDGINVADDNDAGNGGRGGGRVPAVAAVGFICGNDGGNDGGAGGSGFGVGSKESSNKFSLANIENEILLAEACPVSPENGGNGGNGGKAGAILVVSLDADGKTKDAKSSSNPFEPPPFVSSSQAALISSLVNLFLFSSFKLSFVLKTKVGGGGRLGGNIGAIVDIKGSSLAMSSKFTAELR